jgi:hypothetical protein
MALTPTSIAQPSAATINFTAEHARAGGVKHICEGNVNDQPESDKPLKLLWWPITVTWPDRGGSNRS